MSQLVALVLLVALASAPTSAHAMPNALTRLVRRIADGPAPKTALGRKLAALHRDEAMRERLRTSVLPTATVAVARHDGEFYSLNMTPHGLRLATTSRSAHLLPTWMNIFAIVAGVPLMGSKETDHSARLRGEELDRAAELFPHLTAQGVYPAIERERAIFRHDGRPIDDR